MTLTLLIDLDDTLLPDSADKFLPAYLDRLTRYLARLAPPEQVKNALFSATYQAVENTQPDITIKQSFDEHFYPPLHTSAAEMAPVLDDFYTNIYPSLSPISTPDPTVIRFIEKSFENGYRLVVATNPIFPKAATYERLRWAGLPPEKYPFEIITTYEDFHFAKPNPAYFAEILAQLGWPEDPVVMIGNDRSLDIEPAHKLGLATYWVTEETLPPTRPVNQGAGRIDQIHNWIQSRDLEALQPNYNNWTASQDILRVTPAALDTLLKSTPADAWNHQPDPSSWCLTEVICHLRDVDREVHLPRFREVQNDDAPFLPAIDADKWAEERNYQAQNGPKVLREFYQSRETLLEVIAALTEDVREKKIRHAIFGPTTIDEILHIAARHDRLHIQQVSALLQ